MRRIIRRLFLIVCASLPAVARPASPPDELSLIAATLVLEAGGEGYDGMRMVAQVIRQRAADLQVSYTDILTRKKNGFTPFYHYGSASKVVAVGRQHVRFADALKLAQLLRDTPQLLGNETAGATHFDQAGSTAYWAKPKYITLRHRKLVFYRLQLAPNRKTYVFPDRSKK